MIQQELTPKQWIARNKKLTDEQRLEVINSTETLANLAKKFGVSDRALSEVRKKAGTAKKRIVLTDKQKQEIRESKLSNKELIIKYNSSPTIIYRLRKDYERPEKIAKPKKKPIKLPPKKKKTINKLETKYEAENKERAKAIKLAEEFKMSVEWKLQNGWKWKPGALRSMVLKKTS